MIINYRRKKRVVARYMALLVCIIGCGSCSGKKLLQSYQSERIRMKSLAEQRLASHVEEFNSYDDRPPSDGPFDGSNNLGFLRANIPFFISSNDTIDKIYNYRWWMISKHLKHYNDPLDKKSYWVVTEFFGVKPWASLSGAITCPAGHQFYDVRWLRDSQYLRSYADYFMRGSASRLQQRENENFLTYMSRPESHHFSSWMIDGVDAFLRVHPDEAWREDILPYLEQHQQVWDSLFTVKRTGAKTDGMYKILDLYDGMEFSLSAVLGLIASDGAYANYTEDSWRDLYLGWGTTERAAASVQASAYPTAYRKGYPDFYLVRPSVNSYAYGNLQALATLYGRSNSASPASRTKAALYQKRADELRNKVLGVLWNNDDVFFNTYSAGDNEFGVRDYEARVRESVGYTPWYFGLIPRDGRRPYASAWDMFGSKDGFYNHKGMTTAERLHPYYNEQAYAWNGRGWPFQNSVVYKAYANYLRDYKEQVTHADRSLLYDYIEKLAVMHDFAEPNIGEWYIPSDGERFGGEKDYFHSTFPDIIIQDLLGFIPSHDDIFILDPLLPDDTWEYFYLGSLRYHGHDIDIIWKRDWDVGRDGNQSRLCIWVDGKLVSVSTELNRRLVISLGR